MYIKSFVSWLLILRLFLPCSCSITQEAELKRPNHVFVHKVDSDIPGAGFIPLNVLTEINLTDMINQNNDINADDLRAKDKSGLLSKQGMCYRCYFNGFV